MTSHHRDQPVFAADADVTLDLRMLRARVEFNDGVPSLLVADGAVTVQISTGLAGPTARGLILVGRLVALRTAVPNRLQPIHPCAARPGGNDAAGRRAIRGSAVTGSGAPFEPLGSRRRRSTGWGWPR